jgi:hypothetical protein
VPPIAARVFNDPGLTDGARHCAMTLMELVYRRNREGHHIGCTVSYLKKALSRSERTVPNYLCQLRAGVYPPRGRHQPESAHVHRDRHHAAETLVSHAKSRPTDQRGLK